MSGTVAILFVREPVDAVAQTGRPNRSPKPVVETAP